VFKLHPAGVSASAEHFVSHVGNNEFYAVIKPIHKMERKGKLLRRKKELFFKRILSRPAARWWRIDWHISLVRQQPYTAWESPQLVAKSSF